MESASYWNNNKEVRDFWTLWFSPVRGMQKEKVPKMGMRNRGATEKLARQSSRSLVSRGHSLAHLFFALQSKIILNSRVECTTKSACVSCETRAYISRFMLVSLVLRAQPSLRECFSFRARSPFTVQPSSFSL